MRSDAYTIIFTMITSVILGLGLSATRDSLRERQLLNIELDIKKKILSVLGFEQTGDWIDEDVQSMYDNNINEIIISSAGEEVKENNTSGQETYKIYQSRDGNKVKGYAIPISGKGLWGTMYGYFAIEPDASTAKGITFYKHKETPGLGAEVDKDWFKNNFIGKKFIDESGNLVSIEVIKGFVSDKDPNAKHKVDGISGATVTGNGLSTFLKADLQKYEPYFAKIRKLNELESL
ncbi:MAG: NADH:ubiquinone reductase (Na(+)-transporting) subunit C [Candidatus Marinimicrobia bacterium]|nr:NADH:ubiquinone reductase (Na(+)-transporting) subunit C [Candidatus Neomarinimicrobiota bacterium]